MTDTCLNILPGDCKFEIQDWNIAKHSPKKGIYKIASYK